MSSEFGGWLALGALLGFFGSFLRSWRPESYRYHRTLRRRGALLVGAGVFVIVFGIGRAVLPGLPDFTLPAITAPGFLAGLSFWGRGLVVSFASLVLGAIISGVGNESGLGGQILGFIVGGILFFGGVVGTVISVVALIFF